MKTTVKPVFPESLSVSKSRLEAISHISSSLTELARHIRCLAADAEKMVVLMRSEHAFAEKSAKLMLFEVNEDGTADVIKF